MHFNLRSAFAIYQREMARAFRTAFQSILSPVLTTSLYFVVFGSVIGAQMGARFAMQVKPEYLRLILAVIVLLVAVRMLLGLAWQPDEIYSVELL